MNAALVYGINNAKTQNKKGVDMKSNFYFSPFRKFELPDEKELLVLWQSHYLRLNIRTKTRGRPKQKELLVNIMDHERELARI